MWAPAPSFVWRRWPTSQRSAPPQRPRGPLPTRPSSSTRGWRQRPGTARLRPRCLRMAALRARWVSHPARYLEVSRPPSPWGLARATRDRASGSFCTGGAGAACRKAAPYRLRPDAASEACALACALDSAAACGLAARVRVGSCTGGVGAACRKRPVVRLSVSLLASPLGSLLGGPLISLL
eukprot:scaffold8355_cov59-Phaeocystis_antarctica.AAC.1